MKKTRKIVALLIIISMILSPMLFKVFAEGEGGEGNGGYTLSFSVTGEHAISDVNHTPGELVIDGQYIRILDSSKTEETAIGVVTVADDGKSATVSIPSGTKTSLMYNSGEKFTLYVNGNPYNIGTDFDNSTNIAVQDYFEPQNNPGGEGNNQGENNPPQPAQMADLEYTINFGTATWEVRDENVSATVQGKNITNGDVVIKGNETIKLNGFNPEYMQVVIKVANPNETPDQYYTVKLNVDQNNQTKIMELARPDFLPNDIPLIFAVERKSADLPENNLPEPNTSAKVTVSSSESHAGSYVEARLGINGYPIEIPFPEGDNQVSPVSVHFDNIPYFYDEQNDEGKVTINCASLFIEKYVGTITINGERFNVSDFINYGDRTDWLNHYDHQCVGFNIVVDKADSYDIVCDLEPAEEVFIGNFLWTDDSNEKDSDEYIGHSRLELVKVVYEVDGQEVTVTEKNYENDPYIEYDSNFIVSSLVVPEGALCTMRIIPDYGYQVTSFGINGQDIITGDNISEFTFPIHRGNFHLGAQVTKVNDVVDAKSEKVKSGAIKIANNEVSSGSVVLSVNDVNPSEIKIKGFEEAAGNDYSVQTYLDIDLDQVFYKGTSEDVWTNRLHELNNEATITLKLEEGVNGDDIVIVHNISDGDKYEVIQIDSYDPETNTITFRTKSFSNYAIASKTVEDREVTTEDNSEKQEKTENSAEETTKAEEKNVGNNSNNPKTGDKIALVAIVLVIAIFGISITSKNKKKARVGKH